MTVSVSSQLPVSLAETSKSNKEDHGKTGSCESEHRDKTKKIIGKGQGVML